jgi:hypothetical protein
MRSALMLPLAVQAALRSPNQYEFVVLAMIFAASGLTSLVSDSSHA